MSAGRSLTAAVLIAVPLLLGACAAPTASLGTGDTVAHHYTLGLKLLESRDTLPQALEEFTRARDLGPNDPRPREGIGLVSLAMDQLDEAEKAFEQSKDKDSKYPRAWAGLARVYSAKGDHRRARAEAEQAVRLAPRDAGMHLVLGQVLLRAFEFTGAEAAFARAMEIEPAHPTARREWDRSVKIRQAAPGTMVGKRIALADPITRGELATLLATELGVETHLRRRRPELFDVSFRPPGQQLPPGDSLPQPADARGHWAGNAIGMVMRLNLMEAYPDGGFRPDEGVTRASLAGTLEQILSVVTNNPAIKTQHVGQRSPFPDIRSDHFAFNAAVIVTTRGLMEAERPSGAFRLTNPVSGAEAMLALRKLAELL